MKAVLEGARYSVSTAENSETAFAFLEHNHVDLILLDIMMPGIDGYEFTKLIRQSGIDIPILMISAKQLPQDCKRGFLAGTDDYMTKPVDTEEMLLRIKALLRRAKIINDRQITIGDVLLDLDSPTVHRGEEVLELPQKEFCLLYKLLSSPGKIFTRIQLMEDIWGADCESEPDTITVHIGRLRKKIDGWKEFEIVSVRGLGYKAVRKE